MLSVKSEGVKSFHESFYGTPTADEGRRRRGKKRHQAPREEPQNEVAVIGTHYRSFDDDSMAAFVNSATALVPWNGDSKLLIDRYDVRHLLQDLTGIRRRRARPPSPDATKEELDYERYRDVEGLENPSPPPEDDALKNGNAPGGGYQRVGFDYSNGGDQEILKERAEEALFTPPFFVPEHLLPKLPTSTKVHQIMAGTAKYVIEHGGQAEIVLRVKQANNSTFGFLMPDHYHHEYFRFLVDHPEYVGIGTSTQHQVVTEEVAAEASSEEAEGGLSLLGTAYGDVDADEEDKEGVVDLDGTDEVRPPVGEVLGPADEPIKEPVDGNSENGSASKKSSVTMTSEGADNATNDTGDSSDGRVVSELVVVPGEESTGEAPVVRKVSPSSGLQEPVPPGTEASTSGEAEGHNTYVSGDLENQVPPYKEPPVQLRRIIDKMVEFISRNGKEFEAIVRERDKSDCRFPFFLTWNEYYPYYSQALEASTQATAQEGNTGMGGAPVASQPQSSLLGQTAGKDQLRENFLNDVPYWDESWAVNANGVHDDAGTSEMQDEKSNKSHNGEGGMGFDAVLAAVRAATRGRPRIVEEVNTADQTKVPEIGSDEAVMAAIKAATRGSKLDASESGGRGQIIQTAGSSDDLLEGSTDAIKAADSAGFNNSVKHPSTLPTMSNEVVALSLDGNHEVVAHVVAKAAAVAAAEEGDSSEAQLTPHEKRRAERLKKAKLFAAMIKEGKGSLANAGQESGSVGISVTPSSERLHEASVALESTGVKSGDNTSGAGRIVQLEGRDQTGEVPVQETLLESSSKERKHKGKSKEHDEKQRKHHHKRKKDVGEDVTANKHAPDTGERRKERNHDHYQEAKKKDKRHDRQPEEKANNSRRGIVSEEQMKDKRFRQECEDGWNNDEVKNTKGHAIYELEGKRKDSKHRHHAEPKKIRSKHAEDSDEETRKGSRHRHGSEDETRKASKHRHASDEKHRHRQTSEERREHSDKHATDHKMKETRHRHILEEEKSGGRYVRDSDEMKKERSHGKRKKQRDILDDSDDNDGIIQEYKSKRSRRHSGSVDEHTHVERQSRHDRDLKDDRKLGRVAPVKKDLIPVADAGENVTAVEVKPACPPIDVPDDIRAKVRAMLAML